MPQIHIDFKDYLNKYKKLTDYTDTDEYKDLSDEEKAKIQDKIQRAKLQTQSGAVEGDTVGFTSVDNEQARILKQVDAENKKRDEKKAPMRAKRSELVKKLGDDKTEQDLTALANKAGFRLRENRLQRRGSRVLTETMDSYLAAVELKKMIQNGPKDGEDLKTREDKMNRLQLRIDAGKINGKHEQNGKITKTGKVVKEIDELKANQEKQQKENS